MLRRAGIKRSLNIYLEIRKNKIKITRKFSKYWN